MVTSALPALAKPPAPEVVEKYAVTAWNAILHFIIGSEDAPQPSDKVVELLVATRLLAPGQSPAAVEDGDPAARDNDEDDGLLVDQTAGGAEEAPALSFQEIMDAGGGAVHITRAGYRFLLRDTGSQLWTFMSEYLRSAPSRGLHTGDILALLLQLGFCKPGEGVALEALADKPTQFALLDDFAAFGLIFIPEDQVAADPLPADSNIKRELGTFKRRAPPPTREDADIRRFFPTSLAIRLTMTEVSPDAAPTSLTASVLRAAAGSKAFGLNLPTEGGSEPSTLLGDSSLAASAAAVAGHLDASGSPASPPPGHLYVIVEKNFKVSPYRSFTCL